MLSSISSLMRWRTLRGAIAFGVTVVCISFVLPSVKVQILTRYVRRADDGMLGLAVALVVASLVCKAIRWWILYPAWCRPRINVAMAALILGQALNWLLPARLGEAMRLGMVGTEAQPNTVGSTTAVGIGVLLAEKILDGVMLVFAVIILAWLGAIPLWLRTAVLVVSGGAGALGVTVALITHHGERSSPHLPGGVIPIPEWMHQRLDLMASYLRIAGIGLTSWVHSKRLIPVVFTSLSAWILGATTNYLVLRSLGINGGTVAALTVLVALYGGATIPSVPGRVGVFQYLCVLALAPFGVPSTQALAFSVVLYAVVYLPPLTLGLAVSLILHPRSPRLLGRVLRGRRRPSEGSSGRKRIAKDQLGRGDRPQRRIT